MKTSFFRVAILALTLVVSFPISKSFSQSADYDILVPADYPTIQEAIEASFSGAVIGVEYVYDQPYHENLIVPIGAEITIIGFGDKPPIIDGSANGHVIIADGSQGEIQLRLANLRITNGYADVQTHPGNLGGGIYATNTILELDNCHFYENYAQHGAGLYLDSSPAMINFCKFENNHAGDGGAAISINGNNYPGNECIVTRSIFRRNEGDGAGGALNLVDAKFSMFHCTFSDNSNGQIYGPGASAINIWNSGVVIKNCAIVSNRGGAAVWFDYPADNPAPNYADPVIESNLYWDNTGGNYDGIASGTLDIIGDPNFDLDFVPMDPSVCIDAGAAIPGVNDEFCGSGVDIGAIEFCEPYNKPDDRTTLVHFYESLNGDGWINNTNWCTDAPLEEWYGINVANNRVESINLFGNGLSGELPESIWNLDALTFLAFGSNQISGQINNQVSKLSLVNYFDFGHNQLSGIVPDEIGQLTQLEALYLDGNSFTGSIPPSVGNLSKLTTLDLGENGFTGTIPPEIYNLSNLSTIQLIHCEISGSISDSIRYWTKMESIHFHNLNLSGEIPNEIFELSNLKHLYLHDNNLSGSLSDSLILLTNLEALSIYGNDLDGLIPEEIGQLSLMKWFNIGSNQFSGTLPTSMCDWRNLETFHIHGNNFDSSSCSVLNCIQNNNSLSAFEVGPQNNGYDFSDCSSDLVFHISGDSGFVDQSGGRIINNVNGVSIVDGPNGRQAFDFNGTNYFEIEDSDNSLDFQGDFTVEMIVKPIGSEGVWICKSDYDQYPRNFGLLYGLSNDCYGHFYVSGGMGSWPACDNAEIGEWCKIIFISRNGEYLFIEQGQDENWGYHPEFTQSLNDELNDFPLRIGQGFEPADDNFGAHFLNGQIAEVKIYNRALDLSEIEVFTPPENQELVLHLSADQPFVDLAKGNTVDNMNGVSIVSTPWGGNAYYFDGPDSEQFIAVQDADNSLDFYGDFTIEYIVRPTKIEGGVIFSKGGLTGYPKNITFGYGDTPTHYGYYWGTGSISGGSTNFDVNQYKKIVFISRGDETYESVGDEVHDWHYDDRYQDVFLENLKMLPKKKLKAG